MILGNSTPGTPWLFFLLVSFVWGCKEKTVPVQPVQESEMVQPVPRVIRELLTFADISLPDPGQLEDIVRFKELKTEGSPERINSDIYTSLYKAALKSDKTASLPILEIANSNQAILVASGFGYAGRIWATVLIDTSNLEIIKIQLEHSAESDGYGAGITETSFEEQFVGTTINLETETFGLQQSGNLLRRGNRIIDGIGGATNSSEATVYMLNEGLKKYANYLQPK